MKKILALLLALLMMATLVACSNDTNEENSLETIKIEKNVFSNNEFGSFTYAVSADGHYEITAYNLNTAVEHEVVIPNSIDDVLVTAIAADAFKSCTSITAVTVPDSVISIGDFAFYDCDKLAKVTLGASVTEIGVGAFRGCDIIESITLPKNVTVISDQLFWDCVSLKEVVFPEAATVIGEGAFYGCDSLTAISIPATVKEIKSSAFYGCEVLASVNVPASVETIGNAAFAALKAEKVVFTAEKDSAFATYYETVFAPNDAEYAHYELKVN